jgi:hypothetical protein
MGILDRFATIGSQVHEDVFGEISLQTEALLEIIFPESICGLVLILYRKSKLACDVLKLEDCSLEEHFTL